MVRFGRVIKETNMHILLTVTFGFFPPHDKPLFGAGTAITRFEVKDTNQVVDEINEKMGSLLSSCKPQGLRMGTRIDVVSVCHSILP